MSAESASSSDMSQQKRRRRGRRGGRGRRKPATGANVSDPTGTPPVGADAEPAAMHETAETECAEPSAPSSHTPEPSSQPSPRPGGPALVDDATAREMELRARLAHEEQRRPGGPGRDPRHGRPL